MRRTLLLITLIAILSIGAKGSPLMRLTIRNKSGTPLEVALRAEDGTAMYYLHVPIGYRGSPTDTTFTIVKNFYRMRVYYVEEVPAGTRFPCRSSHNTRLIARRNIRVTVVERDRRQVPRGEPGMLKLPHGCIE